MALGGLGPGPSGAQAHFAALYSTQPLMAFVMMKVWPSPRRKAAPVTRRVEIQAGARTMRWASCRSFFEADSISCAFYVLGPRGGERLHGYPGLQASFHGMGEPMLLMLLRYCWADADRRIQNVVLATTRAVYPALSSILFLSSESPIVCGRMQQRSAVSFSGVRGCSRRRLSPQPLASYSSDVLMRSKV